MYRRKAQVYAIVIDLEFADFDERFGVPCISLRAGREYPLKGLVGGFDAKLETAR